MAPMAATVSRPGRRGGWKLEARLQCDRGTGRRRARRCPWCGRPARCCGRAPGRRPRRGGRSGRAAAAGSRPPGCWRPRGGAGSGPWPSRRSSAGCWRRSPPPRPSAARSMPLSSFQQRPRARPAGARPARGSPRCVARRRRGRPPARRWPPASSSSISLAMPFSSAMSPPMRTGRCRQAMGVPAAQHLQRVLRVAKPAQRRLGQRVDADDAAAAPGGLLQGRQHARVVGARVLPDDEDGVGLLEVVQLDRPLAHADASRAAPRRWTRGTCSEQSGRLLVPNWRTNSWYRNAASLLVRPEV